jgi:DNA-binding CsgD family transcriptional regulator
MRTNSDSSDLPIAHRLEVRKAEMEQATMTRVYGISEPPAEVELDYLRGLRDAVSGALDYALQVLSTSDERPPQIPASLLVQARLAARNAIPLDVVLRRYFSGYTLFIGFLFEELRGYPLAGTARPEGLLRGKAGHFDRLVGAVTEEYHREVELAARSACQRQTRLVQRLLGGEPVDPTVLNYELDGTWHLAVVLRESERTRQALRATAEALDCRLLSVRPDPDTRWGWLGRRRRRDPAEIRARLERELEGTPMAVGHPGFGRRGWCLSHRQARSVFPLTSRGGGETVGYAEAGLEAAVARDEVLVDSLRQIYLEPLGGERDAGETLKEALRAWLSCGRNITSAASALGVNRQTVRARLRAVEEKIGCSLDAHAAELEIALRLDRGEPGPAPEGNKKGN